MRKGSCGPGVGGYIFDSQKPRPRHLESQYTPANRLLQEAFFTVLSSKCLAQETESRSQSYKFLAKTYRLHHECVLGSVFTQGTYTHTHAHTSMMMTFPKATDLEAAFLPLSE